MGAAYAYFNRLESEAKKASKEPEVVVVESPSPAKSKAAATRSIGPDQGPRQLLHL